ncbi:hypothetical protein AGMMS50256_35310 [Betaproteobacteria bacterium]|nr:hypothetical protein AGMMS50256_35310 [Betaproteobacteria bacterium]
MSHPSFQKPRWLRDLLRFLPLKSQFVLSGNVRDLQACEMQRVVVPQNFNQTICDAVQDSGHDEQRAANRPVARTLR